MSGLVAAASSSITNELDVGCIAELLSASVDVEVAVRYRAVNLTVSGSSVAGNRHDQRPRFGIKGWSLPAQSDPLFTHIGSYVKPLGSGAMFANVITGAGDVTVSGGRGGCVGQENVKLPLSQDFSIQLVLPAVDVGSSPHLAHFKVSNASLRRKLGYTTCLGSDFSNEIPRSHYKDTVIPRGLYQIGRKDFKNVSHCISGWIVRIEERWKGPGSRTIR